MARRFAVISVEFTIMLLALLVVTPTGTALPAIPATDPTGQIPSGSVAAGTPMQFPWYYCHPWNYLWCYPYYWDHWYYPYYYYQTTTYEKAKTFELKVETSPAGIAAVNGKGTYNDGTAASFSVSSLIVPLNSNQRYIFSSWSGDFSGATPSGTVTMNSPKTVIANYQLQNFLKVTADPQGIVSATGEGWYLPTESVTVGPLPVSISGGEGARYVFHQWTIDDAAVSGNSVQVIMDLPHTVVAHYKAQYLLTVSSDYGITEGAGWYDGGGSATFSVTSPVDVSYGVKQVFERWSGDAQSGSATATITMDSPHAVRAVWRTDSTILYATIALVILAAFALGIGLAMLAFTRLRARRVQLTTAPQTRPVATVEPVPEKLKRARTKKRVEPPPKTDRPEPSAT